MILHFENKESESTQIHLPCESLCDNKAVVAMLTNRPDLGLDAFPNFDFSSSCDFTSQHSTL